MPVSDYNKTKKLDIQSVTGAPTVGKAQPVLLGSDKYTGKDSIESGSSQLGYESNANTTIDSNSQITGTYSIKQSSSNQDVGADRNLSQSISSDGKILRAKLKIDNQTGATNEGVSLRYYDGSGTQLFFIQFEGSGTVYANGSAGTNVGSWSANTVHNLEITVDFTNNTIDVTLDGSTTTGIAFQNNGSEITSQELENNTIASGATVNSFYDELTYTAPAEDSLGPGNIYLDWANIADAQDIAVYDQNGNLLNYEIESLDTANKTGILWCYNSWLRDGTTQAQIAYGSNSANTDRQNSTGTWNNAGQNLIAAYHLNESSGTTVDSGPNGYNSTATTGTTYNVSGQFDGARGFDGTDDEINLADAPNYNGSAVTVALTFNPDSTSGTNGMFSAEGGSYTGYSVQVDSGNLRFVTFGSSSVNVLASSTSLSTNTWYHGVATNSADSGTLYLDGTQENSGTQTYDAASDADPAEIGAKNWSDGNHFNGQIDAVRIYSEEKGSAWVQADYDASPKAGQVFFSQQAAETTSVTVTVADTLAFSETTGSALAFTAADSLNFSENQPATLKDVLADALGFTETAAATLQDTVTDSLTFAENSMQAIKDTVSDTLTFTENTDAQLVLLVTVQDTLSFAESTATTLKATIRETLTFAEATPATLRAAVADTLGFVENVTPTVTFTVSDTLKFAESTTEALASTVSDTLRFSEAVSAARIFYERTADKTIKVKKATDKTAAIKKKVKNTLRGGINN